MGEAPPSATPRGIHWGGNAKPELSRLARSKPAVAVADGIGTAEPNTLRPGTLEKHSATEGFGADGKTDGPMWNRPRNCETLISMTRL